MTVNGDTYIRMLKTMQMIPTTRDRSLVVLKTYMVTKTTITKKTTSTTSAIKTFNCNPRKGKTLGYKFYHNDKEVNLNHKEILILDTFNNIKYFGAPTNTFVNILFNKGGSYHCMSKLYYFYSVSIIYTYTL